MGAGPVRRSARRRVGIADRRLRRGRIGHRGSASIAHYLGERDHLAEADTVADRHRVGRADDRFDRRTDGSEDRSADAISHADHAADSISHADRAADSISDTERAADSISDTDRSADSISLAPRHTDPNAAGATVSGRGVSERMNNPLVTGRLLVKLATSAIVTGTLTLGVAWVVVPPKQSQMGPGPADANRAQVGFSTVPSSIPGTPLGPPPADQLIQLVSINKDAPPPSFGERMPWWLPAGIPRVPHITQFDGGPLASANSVMAAGAMLARLAYGLSTTGSQLRSLQSDKRDSGTTLANLEEALQKGSGVGFGRGAISPLVFRALMYAGAGAVVIVDYGQVPIGLREQSTFLGPHAIYVDAYRGSGVDAAYYVMDPMGQSWKGHVGAWWPAEGLERAAMELSGGSLLSSWAFARGLVPHDYPSLPRADYPSSDPTNPAATPPPPLDALPYAPRSGDATAAARVGDDLRPRTPPETAEHMGRRPLEGVGDIEVFLGICVTQTPPPFCPPGVRAVYRSPKESPPAPPQRAARGPLDLIYTDVPQPGLQRTIFTAPEGVTPTFSYWPSDGSGPVLEAKVEAARLGGKQVWMVTVPIPEAGTYNFVAFDRQAGVISASEVGSITFGP